MDEYLILEKAAETFKIFGDETRLKIFSALDEKELCVNDIAAAVGMSQSVISHHLRILRTSDLVRTEKKGKEVYYRIADDHVKSMMEHCLEHLTE